jgi:chorismate synthase
VLGRLRLLTAGESHGKGLVGILEGLPAGLKIDPAIIDHQLQRRQRGYGRGGRMKIEKDQVEILSGVRWGLTIGSPITLMIHNRDWKNWQEGMSIDPLFKDYIPAVTKPRPGHADLSGVLKFGFRDARNVLERSSARETAMRVALGALARQMLSVFGIEVFSFVLSIGPVRVDDSFLFSPDTDFESLFALAESSEVRCHDAETTIAMKETIDRASSDGDTVGGVFALVIRGTPVGLGSHIQWDTRLDARFAYALMGIQAIKGVEIGKGFDMASGKGSTVMDEIFYEPQRGYYRKTNLAGGIEGGMTNGMPIVIRAAMKPIPTLKRPLASVDFVTKEPYRAAYERSDVCAVPAASVIAEAMGSIVIADAFLEKFGGDSIEETGRNYAAYKEYLNGA